MSLGLKWILLITCWLGMVAGEVSAQQRSPELDSLLTRANREMRSGEFQKAEKKFIQAEKLAAKEGNEPGQVAAWQGIVALYMDDAAVADSVLTLMRPAVMRSGDSENKIYWYLNTATVADSRMQFDYQVLALDSALQLALSVGDSVQSALCFYEIGVAYYNINEFRKAIGPSRQAQEWFHDLNEVYYEAYAHRSIGFAYYELEEFDSSLLAFDASFRLFDQEGSLVNRAYIHYMKGCVYLRMENFPQAKTYFQLAGEEFIGNRVSSFHLLGETQLYIAFSELYLETGEDKKALEYAKKAYHLSDSLDFKLDNYNALEKLVWAGLKNQPELEGWVRQYMDRANKQFEEDKARAVLEFEQKYNAEENEKQILALDLQAKNSDLRAERIRFWALVGLISVVLIVLGMILFFYRNRLKNERKINELNHKALQLQIQPHFFFNALNSINNYIAENDKKSARYYLSKFARLMRLTLENSRMDGIPLEQELELIDAYLQLEKVRRDCFSFEIVVADELKEIQIPPLILQPFVENSVVHAFPDEMDFTGKILVAAVRENGFLRIEISDNGVGIQPKKDGKGAKTSLAIQILTQRLELLGKQKGTLAIGKANPQNSTHPGTRVIIRIPVS